MFSNFPPKNTISVFVYFDPNTGIEQSGLAYNICYIIIYFPSLNKHESEQLGTHCSWKKKAIWSDTIKCQITGFGLILCLM